MGHTLTAAEKQKEKSVTTQEQITAVLEKMGWVGIISPNPKATGYIKISDRVKEMLVGLGLEFAISECRKGFYLSNTPNLLHSLDAIALAEALLTDTKRGWYNAELSKLATGRNLFCALQEPDWIFKLLTATAPQRLEAICRTWWPEKWK